jgi:GT2 family glycosyltransferase
MMLRPEVFQKIGFMDERYFLYWEELEFGRRAIGAGFKLMLSYDVLVYHRTGSQERQHRIYYMWRNQFRFLKKNYGPFLRLIFLMRRVLTSVKELLNFATIKRFDLVGAAMAGLAAGLRGETGKSSNRYAAPSNPGRADNKPGH